MLVNNLTTVEEIISYYSSLAKPENKDIRVICGMSGGVDSSVSAYLLQLQGYQVEGVFMKNWEEDDGSEYCTAAVDYADAQAVCDTLGIKLYGINFASEYWDNVFEYFLDEYARGRTPNPDILCNKEIKFKAFLAYALEDLNADFIATGHYCRGSRDPLGNAALLRGADSNKDQTYFLYTLNKTILERVIFPVGELEKPQVRLLAEHLKLKTAKKKDSTGICFIGERKFTDFLARYLPAQKGDIINLDTGATIGTHNGAFYYTLGQRKGLGIGGIPGHNDAGWFVAAKDIQKNQVFVVDNAQHPALWSQEIIVKQLHTTNLDKFTDILKIDPQAQITCKVRYRTQDAQCTIEYLDDETLRVVFVDKQLAITPGQSAVFYWNEYCLGGGVIEELVA